MNTGGYISNMKEILLVVVWFIAVGIIISVILSAFLSTSISRPINSLAVSLRLVEAGDFTIRVPEKRKEEIGQLNSSFNTMVNQLDSLIRRTKEEEQRRSEAERKALQSQINPHLSI
jgi:two-component system sensor histidine kinase YesM